MLGSTQPCSINKIECIYFYGLYSKDKITNVHLLVISHIHLCLINKWNDYGQMQLMSFDSPITKALPSKFHTKVHKHFKFGTHMKA